MEYTPRYSQCFQSFTLSKKQYNNTSYKTWYLISNLEYHFLVTGVLFVKYVTSVLYFRAGKENKDGNDQDVVLFDPIWTIKEMKMDFPTGNIGVKVSPILYCWQDEGNLESIAGFLWKDINYRFWTSYFLNSYICGKFYRLGKTVNNTKEREQKVISMNLDIWHLSDIGAILDLFKMTWNSPGNLFAMAEFTQKYFSSRSTANLQH